MSTAQGWQFYDLKTPENSRALEAGIAMLEAKIDNSSDENLFPDEKPKTNNKNDPAFNRKGSSHRCFMVRVIERGKSAQQAERQIH